MIRVRVLLLLTFAAVASSAQAQVNEPIGWFAADVRGVLARFKEDPAIASPIGVTSVNLPTRGLGASAGVHVYPWRRRSVAFGIGGEVLVARDSRTLEPATATAAEGPTVTTRMTSATPQISLNFGRANGWSYISGGIGWASFTSERTDRPVGDPEGRTRAMNYGGGARWFMKDHLALSVDLRFYTINAQAAAVARPAFPRMRLMVISVGAAFK